MGNEAQAFVPELGAQEGPQPGPSWANARWPLANGADDLTDALDPTAMKLAVKAAAEKAGKPLDEGIGQQLPAANIR